MSGSTLTPYLTKFRRRLRLRDGWLLAQRMAWIALIGVVSLLVLGRVIPIKGLIFWAFTPILLWLCAIVAYSLFHPKSLEDIAKQADLELKLKERISTAYELELRNKNQFSGSSSSHRANLPSYQHNDALSIAYAINPKQAFPIRWLRGPILVALGILMVVLILIYLPNPMDTLLADRTAVEKTVLEQAEKIEDFKEEIEQSEEITPELEAELLRQLAELVQQLRNNPGDRGEALADISHLEELLHRQIDPNTDLRQESLKLIGSRLKSLAQQTNEQSSISLPEAIEQLSSGFENLNPTDQKGLAKDLAELAALAAQSGEQPLAQALAAMSQAALSGDKAAASQAAGEISRKLALAQERQIYQQVLQRSLEQLINSSQAIAQAGQTGQQVAAQGPGQGTHPKQSSNPGAGQDGQGTSGGGTKADMLPPGTGTGLAGDPEDFNTGLVDGDFDEQVFIPWERRPQAGEEVSLPGQDTGQGETIIRENPNPSGGLPGPALIPYQQVYFQYIEAAQLAINRSDIPSSYRDLVRDYFTQLEP